MLIRNCGAVGPANIKPTDSHDLVAVSLRVARYLADVDRLLVHKVDGGRLGKCHSGECNPTTEKRQACSDRTGLHIRSLA